MYRLITFIRNRKETFRPVTVNVDLTYDLDL